MYVFWTIHRGNNIKSTPHNRKSEMKINKRRNKFTKLEFRYRNKMFK